MIIKSMSRKTGSFGGLIEYMDKEQKLAEEQLDYQTRNKSLEETSIKHLLKGNRASEWVEQFEKNQQGRKYKRSDMVLFYHEIISFSPKDTELITDEMLHDISRQYIRIRSPYAPAVATIHHDVDHLHVHFCIAGCQYKTGLANRLSKTEFAQVKKEMQEYQQTKYPQLTNSIVEHGKGLETIKQLEFQSGERKLGKRAMVKAQVEAVFAQSNDYNQLLASLEQAGMPTYVRGGRVYGVAVEGKKYRFKTLGLIERFEELAQKENQLQELENIHNSKDRQRDLFKEEITEEQSIEHNSEIIDVELESIEPLKLGSVAPIKPEPIEPTETIKPEPILGELEDFTPSQEPKMEDLNEVVDVEWEAIESTDNKFEDTSLSLNDSLDPMAMEAEPSTGGSGISVEGGGVASIIGNIILGLTLSLLSRAPSHSEGDGNSYEEYNILDRANLQSAKPTPNPVDKLIEKHLSADSKKANDKEMNADQNPLLAEIDEIRERSQKGRSLDELEMNDLLTEFDQSIIDIESEESDLDSDPEANDFSLEE